MPRRSAANGWTGSRAHSEISIDVVIALAVALCTGFAAPATAQSSVEFWTIAPNEGESAGGHSAIRIGESIYHVQHRGDGLIIDQRDSRSGFERVYRQLGNRSIEVIELGLPPRVVSQLESILRDRYFERKIRLDRLAEFEVELAWLERGLALGRLEVDVPGLGLLSSESPGCLDQEADSMRARKKRISTKLGNDWLESRTLQFQRELRLANRAATTASGDASAQASIKPRIRRVVEAAQMLAALEAIQSCRPPVADRLIPVTEDEEGWPREGDGAPPSLFVWAAVAVNAEEDLMRLLASDRPDAGLAILLSWTRLSALDVTLETGVVTVLDSLAEAPLSRRSEADIVPRPWRDRYRASSRARLERRIARIESAGGETLEAKLFGVEVAIHQLGHARRDAVHQSPKLESRLRVTRTVRHPSRTMPLPWPTDSTLTQLDSRRAVLADLVRSQRAELHSTLGYRLFRRNCVTELLSALDEAALADSLTSGFGEARRRDALAPLSFIPVVAQRIVQRHANVIATRHLPSWREAWLARGASGGESRIFAVLRESNTLSSLSYPRNLEDSAFLFFSQQPAWLRPLLGVANLATGLGTTLIGAIAAPFDHGTMAKRGMNGVLMSVPELFFFNVRKGSYVIVPPGSSAALPVGASWDRGT